ncbi:2-phosphosulfolactate phosphatase [Gimesia algae]|uniref:Probable 2-phosphosulfolactate phosphatase n=1 Tax=Gimesia algae TaxID=2527971 RepID=A0A517V993_9PLAN|nr:2-phosphosulfolactate phosphatase [Gimesia algae]QDT89581.1 putative 2-phosphosulfolactate phosphatase [Gimesia algae]
MPDEIRTCLLPVLSQPEDFSGSTAVILDILRASSTITTALHSSAAAVIPCEEIEQAQQIAGKLNETADSEVLLGGERGGIMIEGFDLDNSPARYSTEVVAGKQIVFTTSNGTRALKRAIQANRILIGSFLNLAAVVNELSQSSGVIYLVCAGTDGAITGEDCLCAGAIAAGLQEMTSYKLTLDDATRMVVDYYQTQVSRPDGLLTAMRASQGGRNLIQRGFEEDIQLCSDRDCYPVLPEFSHESGKIMLSSAG